MSVCSKDNLIYFVFCKVIFCINIHSDSYICKCTYGNALVYSNTCVVYVEPNSFTRVYKKIFKTFVGKQF